MFFFIFLCKFTASARMQSLTLQTLAPPNNRDVLVALHTGMLKETELKLSEEEILKDYKGYYEHQEGNYCGKHALNNAFGKKGVKKKDLDKIAKQFEEAEKKLLFEEAEKKSEFKHHSDSGDYSQSVLVKAASKVKENKSDQKYIISFKLGPEMLHNDEIVGAFAWINIGTPEIITGHWIALKYEVHTEKYWVLDTVLGNESYSVDNFKSFVDRWERCEAVITILKPDAKDFLASLELEKDTSPKYYEQTGNNSFTRAFNNAFGERTPSSEWKKFGPEEGKEFIITKDVYYSKNPEKLAYEQTVGAIAMCYPTGVPHWAAFKFENNSFWVLDPSYFEPKNFSMDELAFATYVKENCRKKKENGRASELAYTILSLSPDADFPFNNGMKSISEKEYPKLAEQIKFDDHSHKTTYV